MRLKAMFANEDEKLWPGDFVNARVLIDVRHDVLVDSVARHPARPGRDFRLGREATTTCRGGASDHGRADDRRPDDRHLGAFRGRARRRRRPVQAAAGFARDGEQAARRRRLPSGTARHEHLPTLHRAAGRDVPADGGGRLCRAGRVPVSSGGAAAAGGFSDHSGERDAAGRQRRDHGGIGRGAAGAPVRANSRGHAA